MSKLISDAHIISASCFGKIIEKTVQGHQSVCYTGSDGVSLMSLVFRSANGLEGNLTTMAAPKNRRSLWVSILWLTVCCGCSEAIQPLRVAVHGTVQAGRSTHAAGWVTFAPTGNQKGARVTADLVAGNYRFDRSNGPTPGSYTVLVGLTQDAAAAKERLLAEPPKSDPLNSQTAGRTDEAGFQLHEFQIEVPKVETHERNFVIE